MRFEDLEVWKRAARLSADIYKALRHLTDYGFRDQVTRCSLSIPSNNAEGFERLSQKECLTLLSYAKGSCAELRTQILIRIDIDMSTRISERFGSKKQRKYRLCLPVS